MLQFCDNTLGCGTNLIQNKKCNVSILMKSSMNKGLLLIAITLWLTLPFCHAQTTAENDTLFRRQQPLYFGGLGHVNFGKTIVDSNKS